MKTHKLYIVTGLANCEDYIVRDFEAAECLVERWTEINKKHGLPAPVMMQYATFKWINGE